VTVRFVEVESGKRADRPELGRALDACRKHKAELVIANNCEARPAFPKPRLHRNLMESGVEFVARSSRHWSSRSRISTRNGSEGAGEAARRVLGGVRFLSASPVASALARSGRSRARSLFASAYRSQAARWAACSSRVMLGDLAGLPPLMNAPCPHCEQMSTRGGNAAVAPTYPQFGQVIRVSMIVTIAAVGVAASVPPILA
jgi:hypothetical protein